MLTGRPPSDIEITNGIEKAESLPKIDPETLPPDERENAKFYFNKDFYGLFLALYRKKTHSMTINDAVFLERAEKFGNAWKEFLAQNQALLKEIEEILKDLEVFISIEKLSRKINTTCFESVAQDFMQKAQMDKITASLRTRLNPLLKKAAAAMDALDIDSSKFIKW